MGLWFSPIRSMPPMIPYVKCSAWTRPKLSSVRSSLMMTLQMSTSASQRLDTYLLNHFMVPLAWKLVIHFFSSKTISIYFWVPFDLHNIIFSYFFVQRTISGSNFWGSLKFISFLFSIRTLFLHKILLQLTYSFLRFLKILFVFYVILRCCRHCHQEITAAVSGERSWWETHGIPWCHHCRSNWNRDCLDILGTPRYSSQCKHYDSEHHRSQEMSIEGFQSNEILVNNQKFYCFCEFFH